MNLTPADAKAAITTSAAVNLSICCAAMGISQATGSRLIAAGEFPVPIIRMGSRVVVPTAPLLKLLHLDEVQTGETAEGGDAA